MSFNHSHKLQVRGLMACCTEPQFHVALSTESTFLLQGTASFRVSHSNALTLPDSSNAPVLMALLGHFRTVSLPTIRHPEHIPATLSGHAKVPKSLAPSRASKCPCSTLTSVLHGDVEHPKSPENPVPASKQHGSSRPEAVNSQADR